MKYELMVLATAPKSDTEAKKAFSTVEAILKTHKVTDLKENYWGKRDLAYEIKADTVGYYTVYTFNVEESEVKEMTLQINLNESIKRYMLTKDPVDVKINKTPVSSFKAR